MSVAAKKYLLIFFSRYNVGPTYYKTWFFKLYFGSLFSVFWFATLVAVLRFLQVCVWKRVKEFNEELLSRMISLSMMAVCGLQGALTNPEFKLFAIVSGSIKK